MIFLTVSKPMTLRTQEQQQQSYHANKYHRTRDTQPKMFNRKAYIIEYYLILLLILPILLILSVCVV